MPDYSIRGDIPQQTLLNEDEDDQMSIESYRLSNWRWSLTWLTIILSVGTLRIVFYWKPVWMLKCTHYRCSINTANVILLTDRYQQKFVENILDQSVAGESTRLMPQGDGQFLSVNRMRHFFNKKTQYVWDFQKQRFVKLSGLDYEQIRCDTLHAHRGLSKIEQNKRLALFGHNVIDIRVQPILKILFREVLNPFYIYQAFAIVFWTLDEYYYYSIYIVIMSLVSLVVTTYEIRVNQRRLREKVHGSTEVLLCRGGSETKTETIDSSRLVPGDVFIVDNFRLYCDAVLLNGEAIVDESMLTGESNPVTKTAIRNSADVYRHRLEARHILFSGTQVMQCNHQNGQPPRAVVVRTNFQTAKGELVRSILFPKPVDFKFNQNLSQFMGAMGLMALAGFIYTVVMKGSRNDPIKEVIFKAIDLITVIVPPELPAALTIATIFSERRLKNQKIYCMSPRSINISGCIDCVVFDKTGTLTEDVVDVEEVLHANRTTFHEPVQDIEGLEDVDTLKQCLASCHSLKMLNEQLIGDDMEVKLFEATKWTFEQQGERSTVNCGKLQLELIKQFPFSSSTARMAVIARENNNNDDNMANRGRAKFFLKGAPEVISKFCAPETIPSSFEAVLKDYTQRSYRVLGLAYKDIDIGEDVENSLLTHYEHQLVFLGLVALRNKLKPDTLNTIDVLNDAQLRVIMATGDNIVTAISVAKECNIIRAEDEVVILEHDNDDNNNNVEKPTISCTSYGHQTTSEKMASEFIIKLDPNENYKLAMTGTTFEVIRSHYPQLMNMVAARGSIYARMLPEQKQQLIESLQQVEHFVAMCGDGANDCGALKAGLSLSDTEASVASPFTSVTGTVSSVIDLVMEGRASLTSVSGVIRYMTTYNIATFLAYCILYYFYSALTDWQNLYDDVAINSLYVFLFSRNYPHKDLSRRRPPISLIGIPQFASILLQLVLVAIFQSGMLFYTHEQPWFVPHNVTLEEIEDKSYECHDNLTMFGVLTFQYMVLCIIFAKGAPFRQPFYKNRLLTIAMVVTFALTAYMIVIPDRPFEDFAEWFGVNHPDYPVSFRLQVVAAGLLQLALALFVENIIVDKGISEWVEARRRTLYDRLHGQTDASLDWVRTPSSEQ